MKYKILLVEDGSSWQKILDGKIRRAVQNMNDADCDIKIIDNFDEAYTALMEGSWDLLVTDIGFKNSEQEEEQKLGKQLVEVASEKNVPAIVVSGAINLNRGEVREILKKLGAVDFLPKETFDAKEFIDVVQEVLQNQQQPTRSNLSMNDDSQVNIMPNTIPQSDIDKLVNVLAPLAATSNTSPQEFFKDLLNRANLPQKWVNGLAGGWTGNPNNDARKLINWALAKNGNPQDKRLTTLGSILQPLLIEVGFNDAILIVSLIIIYQLCTDKKLLETLRIKYQVPISATNITPTISDFGPEINWQEPDKTELESLFKPEPDFLDVGFLMQAIQHATSVCRIEISNQGIGTGFLIAPNLVLTNYHVLYSENTDTPINPSDIILRFGYFTSATGNETEGQTFKLDSDKPILESSPINELDYALIQVEDRITQAPDITPADCEFKNLPEKNMSLNILQHPEGASMKIAISSNAIANIFPDSGLMQYVTKTSSGSSGSPCFNEDWKVVALHHAQKATHFGSIREGILLNSIYKEIEQHLG
ncbi:MAG: trypsin-like peptidase domain-containing protein [Cyanobacteria bacterium P01_A01_bin.68]